MRIRAGVLVLIAVVFCALSINSAHATVGGVNSSTGPLPIGANGSVFLRIDPSGVTNFLNGATTTASINSLNGEASFAASHITIPAVVSGYHGFMLDGGQDSFGSAITRRAVRLYTEQGGGMAGVQVSQDETNPFATWQMNVDGAGNFRLVHPGMSANIFVTPGNANPANGRVGINTMVPQATLDVNGEVHIGSTGVSCSSSNEGTQRYNHATHTMQYCNGTDWAEMGDSIGLGMCPGITPGAPPYPMDYQQIGGSQWWGCCPSGRGNCTGPSGP